MASPGPPGSPGTFCTVKPPPLLPALPSGVGERQPQGQAASERPVIVLVTRARPALPPPSPLEEVKSSSTVSDTLRPSVYITKAPETAGAGRGRRRDPGSPNPSAARGSCILSLGARPGGCALYTFHAYTAPSSSGSSLPAPPLHESSFSRLLSTQCFQAPRTKGGPFKLRVYLKQNKTNKPCKP